MRIRKHIFSIITALIFLTGLCLLLYPSLSEWTSARGQSRRIESYAEIISGIREEEYRQILQKAHDCNKEIARTGIRFHMSDQEKEEYRKLLNVEGTSVMAYIEIPRIGILLPVCHGTEEEVLLRNICHMEGTSLPVGGESSHCVLTGHRGLPGARLFTDLDDLMPGDIFTLHVLDQVLTYQVDRVRIVRPDDLSWLVIYEGQDLCTLLTCTPYGINTHRLLVRGKRIETEMTPSVPTAKAGRKPLLLAAAVMAALLAITALVWMGNIMKRRRKREGKGSTSSRI